MGVIAVRQPPIIRARHTAGGRLLTPERRDDAPTGHATTVQLGAALAGTQATTVRWQASSNPSGLVVSPSSGTLTLAPPHGGPGGPVECGQTTPTSQALSVTAPAAGAYALRIALTTTSGQALPPVVIDVEAST